MPAERHTLALLLVASMPVAAMAAEAPPVLAVAPASAPAPTVTVADAELLEFLGEFHDAKGEFVDPFVIDAVGKELDQAERDAQKRTSEQAAPAAQPEKKP